jgi:hypothetical protein
MVQREEKRRKTRHIYRASSGIIGYAGATLVANVKRKKSIELSKGESLS